MIVPLRRHYLRLKARVHTLCHKKDFEDVEFLVGIVCIWQSYYFAAGLRLVNIFPDDWGAALMSTRETLVGGKMVRDYLSFWGGKPSVEGFATILMVIGLVSIVALLEEETRLRMWSMRAAFCWWLFAGTLLTLNTPHHAAGGLQLVLASCCGWVCTRLARQRGREAALLETAARLAVHEGVLGIGEAARVH